MREGEGHQEVADINHQSGQGDLKERRPGNDQVGAGELPGGSQIGHGDQDSHRRREAAADGKDAEGESHREITQGNRDPFFEAVAKIRITKEHGNCNLQKAGSDLTS